MKRSLFPALVFLSTVVALGAVFLYAPTEKEMGEVQRIFYFHVPAAISAFAAFFLVFVGSVQYLRTRQDKWDRLALCAAELGVMFSLIVLITGPLWARPIWGVYWRWEPRLTSMLILFALYVAYLMMRAYGADAAQTPRLASVLGILAFANVPLVYYSVRLWSAEQQLHPREVTLEPAMKQTLSLCFLAFFLLLIYLLRLRMDLARAEGELVRLRRELTDGSTI
jgi:heme exporter protein C